MRRWRCSCSPPGRRTPTSSSTSSSEAAARRGTHGRAVRAMTPFAGCRARAPSLFYGLLFLVAAELVTALAAPLAVPDYVYLRSYLDRRARETTQLLLADRDGPLVYDSLLGWRARPGASYGNWRIDGAGSRSTHPVGLARSGRTRVLFLGNSLVNGGA